MEYAIDLTNHSPDIDNSFQSDKIVDNSSSSNQLNSTNSLSNQLDPPTTHSSDHQLPSTDNSHEVENHSLPSTNNCEPPRPPACENLFRTVSPEDGKIKYFPPDFFVQASQNKEIFPDMQPRKDKEKKKKTIGDEEIILYLAEIINIECHADVKCGKFKVGYIIRESLNSSHRSRLTHLTPFANFYW